jgi:hypothetical protein
LQTKYPLQSDNRTNADIVIKAFGLNHGHVFVGKFSHEQQDSKCDRNFSVETPACNFFQVSYLGVDTLMARSPPLVKDKYFDDVNLKLPYTEASVAYKKKTYRGSVHDMQ